MSDTLYIFLLGASFMFCAMIAWFFWRKGTDMLSRLVMALMVLMALGFIKDAALTGNMNARALKLSTISDLVVMPLYACILYELCRPGRLSLKAILAAETPFVVLPVLLAIFRNSVFYCIDMSLAIVLGLGNAVWACFAIPRYHRHLKANFSYDDDINLKWLQYILWAFFVILTLWTISCIDYNPWVETAYIVLMVVLWIFVCFFLYRHKSVVYELRPIVNHPVPAVKTNNDAKREIFARIRRLIEHERIYLNPRLKLSDIARMAHTNRTYASAYFNSEAGETFFDHINRLRVEYAISLLSEGNKVIEEIAILSGFNSRQSFHRVFVSIKGISPCNYRASLQLADKQD